MASLNLNKAIIAGRLTSDPELRQTPSGIAVTRFTVAVNRRHSSKEGEQPQADFINCVAWRNNAQFVCAYFRKGSSISIVGEINTGSYTTDSGEKRYTTEVKADEVHFVDSKGESQAAGQQTAQNVAQTPTQPAPNWQEVSNDDELPF